MIVLIHLELFFNWFGFLYNQLVANIPVDKINGKFHQDYNLSYILFVINSEIVTTLVSPEESLFLVNDLKTKWESRKIKKKDERYIIIGLNKTVLIKKCN